MKRLVILTALIAFAWMLISCDTPQANWHEAPKPAKSVSVVPQPPPSLPTVRQGAFCSPEGAMGKSASGNPMRCIRHPGEDQPRWRME